MSRLAQLLSMVALLATLLPSTLFLMGYLAHDDVKSVALAGAIVWFLATPFWMGRAEDKDEPEASAPG